jgi:hypothetical protein
MSVFRKAILLSGPLLALVSLQTIAQAGGGIAGPPRTGITVPTYRSQSNNQIYGTTYHPQFNQYAPGHITPLQRVRDAQAQADANRQAARDGYKAQQDEYKNVGQILNDHQANATKQIGTICHTC